MQPFHKVLTRLRNEAGHPSTRAFYNSQGGQSFFKCTYRQFLNIENEKSLPSGGLIERFAVALNLSRDRDHARDFLKAYIRALTGSEDIVTLISSAFAGPAKGPATPPAPLTRSITRRYRENRIDLTKSQSALILSNPEAYWGFTILSHDKGRWTSADIAKASGLSAAKLKKALAKLKEAKLIAIEKSGKYSCPEAGKIFRYPSDTLFRTGVKPLRKLRGDVAKKRGGMIYQHFTFSRASEAELREYLPRLEQASQGAEVCATLSKGDDTIFYEIETSVRKILSF